MSELQRITIYPIKSFDGHHLAEATVLSSGVLNGDRRFALTDEAGNFVNGKRCAAIQRIRARYDNELQSVVLTCGEDGERFTLEPENRRLVDWCEEILGTRCRLVENRDAGFPDDGESPGPTMISTATLVEVASWFDGMDLQEARRRFRMNLEVGSETPFWEDRLVGERNGKIRFRIGQTNWQGRGICQRCAVPSRDARSGTVSRDFARTFSRSRQQTLPHWSPEDRFDHFYRLGINTALDSTNDSNIIRVGDRVQVIERD